MISVLTPVQPHDAERHFVPCDRLWQVLVSQWLARHSVGQSGDCKKARIFFFLQKKKSLTVHPIALRHSATYVHVELLANRSHGLSRQIFGQR